MPGKGILDMKTNTNTDLHLHFHVEFTDSEKLTKYRDIFHKIFKRPGAEGGVNIHELEK
jgi:hypothetical protein